METTTYPNIQLNMLERDKKSVWHPYTQAKTSPSQILLTKGEGAYLYSNTGTRFFDAISSWWVTTHGHCHPHISQAIANQSSTLDQAVFADFTHENGIVLAERLLHALKIDKGKVFFSDNGSTAVEAALKMAIQYWRNRYAKNHSVSLRSKIICFENAYHGDTFGAMSASGKTPFNRPFWPYLFQVETVPTPTPGNEELAISSLRTCLENNDVAAFIFEPVVQGAAGMVIHCPKTLNEMIAICKSQDVITIADEVMTGFGRTGPLFACEMLSHQPDITCLSKGITGGFLPLGATVCSEFIYEAFLDNSLEHAFLHGHSYCANPITCAAALASLDLYDNPECALNRRLIASHHESFRSSWEHHPKLNRCCSIGTILVVEYKVNNNDSGYFSKLKSTISHSFMANNIYIRPMGNVLYLIPPYCSSTEDLENTYSCIINTLETL